MKYLISEGQNRLLKEDKEKLKFEFFGNKLFEKQVSRGQQPHIDKGVLRFLNIEIWSKEFRYLTQSLSKFLGSEQSVKLTEELLQQTFKTERYNFSGGYSFEFKVKPIIDQEEGQMWVEVYILPGGTVDLADGEITDLKQALNEESYGYQIENEVKEIIDEVFTEEITYKTGISVDLETVIIQD